MKLKILDTCIPNEEEIIFAKNLLGGLIKSIDINLKIKDVILCPIKVKKKKFLLFISRKIIKEIRKIKVEDNNLRITTYLNERYNLSMLQVIYEYDINLNDSDYIFVHKFVKEKIFYYEKKKNQISKIEKSPTVTKKKTIIKKYSYKSSTKIKSNGEYIIIPNNIIDMGDQDSKIKIYAYHPDYYGCLYSMEALKLLDKLKIKNEKIYVRSKSKALEYKKMNKMNTFPQIFFINSGKTYKIGGFTDLEKIVEIDIKLNKKKIYDKKKMIKVIGGSIKNINTDKRTVYRALIFLNSGN